MSEMGSTETSILRQSEHGLTCLSWNDCPFEPAKIAVGGFSRFAAIWTCDQKTGKWKEECVLGEHSGVVHDIAWAPVMGRSYHQIATASRDNVVRVFNLTRKGDGSLELTGNPAKLTCKSQVWRVAWNATGTILATSGDDGALSLWRKNFNGQWDAVQETKPTKN
jgi:nucleoporin SEH1